MTLDGYNLNAEFFCMKREIYLLAILMIFSLFCSPALAKPTNSCDGVAVSFSKHAFASQASQTSLTEAVATVKANGATPQEIICASLNIDGVTTADIINALRNAGFDPVLIRMAAKDTGLNMGEVGEALTPGQDTPAPLPTSVGLSPGKNASPSTP